MASKADQGPAASGEDIADLLDVLNKALDRVKVLYEQYFLGIQKQAPAYLHTDVERKLRDLTQLQIRNTGLRFRLATIQQKFGSYNMYWRRTLRQIENGTYARNLSKIGREAVRTGAAIPEEILAAMPKRMREQVQRDRDQALAIAQRHHGVMTASVEDELLTLMPEGAPPPELDADQIAMISEPSIIRRDLRTRSGAHVLEDDGDVDFEKFFAAIDEQPAPAAQAKPPPPLAKPAAAPVTRPTSRTTPPPAMPRSAVPMPAGSPTAALPKQPSQVTRPIPIVPGAAAARGAVPVESLAGPFPRAAATPPQVTPSTAPSPVRPPPIKPPPIPPAPQSQPIPKLPSVGAAPKPAAAKPAAAAPAKPAERAKPPGMTDDDVNALYATYVKAKEMIGERVGPAGYDKLLKTINSQAPKIMEQYKAKAVDFSIVVKDNQVIIRAKPKG